MKKKSLLLLMTLIMSSISYGNEQKLGMKILVLSPKNDNNGQLVTALNVLRAQEIPFDVKFLADASGNLLNSGSLNLENNDGSGKYYGIILTENKLTMQVGSQFVSALNTSQWSELKNYKSKFSVRQVSLLSDPSSLAGVRLIAGGSDAADSVGPASSFSKLDESIAPSFFAPLKYSWHYKAELSSGSNCTPFAYYGGYNNGYSRSLAGVQCGNDVSLFYSQVPNSAATYALAPAWVKWLTRGIHLGKRRVYLNVHIDDVFLATDLDKAHGLHYSRKDYRNVPFDIEHFAKERKGELLAYTKNPEYRIELAFNGQGIEENGGYDRDTLYRAARNNIKEFYWVSHTYTHMDMNKMKYERAMWELGTNVQVADRLMSGAREFFSPNSMVTPHISGLFNGNALRAMKQNNIWNVVGDNSVPKLVAPHAQTAYYTTAATNGEEGILIMPREATDIYYNTSVPQELLETFNSVHSGWFKKKYNFDNIFEIENERAVPNLLNYRLDPYMFHQANIRAYSINGSYESLVSHWIKAVLKDYRQYSTLPILAVKMDDLAKIYKNRFSLERCSPNGQLKIVDGSVREISVWARGRCQISVTANGNDFVNVSTTSYGPDKTVSYSVDSGSNYETFELDLKSPISFQ